MALHYHSQISSHPRSEFLVSTPDIFGNEKKTNQTTKQPDSLTPLHLKKQCFMQHTVCKKAGKGTEVLREEKGLEKVWLRLKWEYWVFISFEN